MPDIRPDAQPADPHLERTALLSQLYVAFNRRDVEAVLAQLAPDVDWPNVLESTRVVGHAAVRDYWTRQFEQIDPHVEPTDFVTRGDEVIVTVHQVVRDLHGTVLRDSLVVHAYAFRDGLVQRMDVHASGEDALATTRG